MNKIKKVSKRFRIFFQIMFILIPLGVIWFWLVFHGKHDVFKQFGIGASLVSRPITVDFLSRALAMAVSIIPTGIILYCLTQLIKLFKNYEDGNIFVFNNVICYQKLGYALFSWVIGGIIYEALISLALTFQNAPKLRLIATGISSIDLVALIAGGIILLISWVMKEAYKTSKEQSLMI